MSGALSLFSILPALFHLKEFITYSIRILCLSYCYSYLLVFGQHGYTFAAATPLTMKSSKLSEDGASSKSLSSGKSSVLISMLYVVGARN